ncbi:MAG: EAL domain-containing protein [Mariprofundaceae bacterium]
MIELDSQSKNALLSGILELSVEAVVCVDEEQNIILFNHGAEDIFGYSSEEVLGKSIDILMPEKYRAMHYQHMQNFIESDENSRHMKRRAEIVGLRKNGEQFPAEASISKVHVNDKVIVTSILQDITERKQAYEKLAHQANYDSLTSLPNRALLNDRLEHAFERARRDNNKVAVLFLDLNRFKSVNDTLGYSVGDKLLVEVSERLTSRMREEDTIGRLVGDEFLIIMEGLNRASDAGTLAQKLADSFIEPFIIEGHELFMSTSIGISIFPDDGEKKSEQISNADVAMYQVKKDDKNTYQFYSQELTTAAVERATLESHLRCAVQRNELILHYQPQVSLKTGEIIGAEALVRWQHPEMGMVSPGKFIPLAEECGLIVPIGEWVLRTACKQMATWKRKGYPLDLMAVNIAGPQITQIDLVSLAKDVLEETGLEPQHLELEITEGFVMHNPIQAIRLLYELKKLGVVLAIDDFGTGHSSLAYLKQFPVDKLKIDQSFVKNVTNDKHDAAIARAIITLGHALDLNVIAEGIEAEEQRDFLHSEDCDEGQGYLYGRPVEAEAFEKLLA